MTVRDLLTHTSGIGDMAPPRFDASLAELVTGYAREPLQFAPGLRWSYSNPGINTLGRIVEVAGGKPFATFLETRLLAPLGMTETTFWPTPAQAKRLASSYKQGANGALEEVAIYFVNGGLSDRRRTPFPAGGLFSTARDMGRFYTMMLQQGVTRRGRLLSQSAVRQLTTTQTGDIQTGFVDGMSWGFGFQVVKEPRGVTAMLSPGTFGHGGAYATQSWADPVRGLSMVLMIQRAGLPNGDASEMRRAFQEAAVAVF
jgi:CubicO group peptidase (beta-lactamase class C family)